MTEPLRAAESPDGNEPEVDVDLDLLDEALRRESVGEPTTVRIDGKVIHIMHAGEWPSSAMRAASVGNWEDWATAVITDSAEYEAWLEADLANYQIEAVFAECGRQARMSMGKFRRSSGSSRNSRRH